MPTLLLPGALPSPSSEEGGVVGPASGSTGAATATAARPGKLAKTDSNLELKELGSLSSIEAKLDLLSDQMELFLAELVPKATPPSGQAASRNLSSKFLKIFPGMRSSKTFANRVSHRSRSSKTSRFSDRTEIAESEPKRGSVQTNTRRTQVAPRSMDLEIAWRLHAKELGEESDPKSNALLRLVHRSRADIVWELLDDPNSGRWAWMISQFLKAIVIFSVLLSTLQTTEESVLNPTVAAVWETIFDCMFLVEFLCRVLSAPSKRNYFMDPLNWADIVSSLGLPLRASIGFVVVPSATGAEDVVQHLLLFLMPIVHFLKLLRYFESFRLLIDACGKSAEALPVLIYMTCLIVLMSATLIYLVEERSNIPSMPHSMWLALVTMTTVGYGDYYPTSLSGYLIVAVLTFVSVLFLALPVGIIGYEFTCSWQSRVQVLLMTRFRKALNKWGYGAQDLRVLINYVDVNMDGELTFGEFVELIKQMRIGISTEEAALLFGFFDLDQSGSVDHQEMMKHLFPLEYVKSAGESLSDCHHSDRVSAAMEQFGADRQWTPKDEDPPLSSSLREVMSQQS